MMKNLVFKNNMKGARDLLIKPAAFGFITALCIAATSMSVWAGTITATGDKENAAVGDAYTVTVKVENDEGAAVAPDVSVNYDVNRLSFTSCSGEYGGGAGGFITLGEGEYTISFNILSGGQADVDVTGIFDGDGASMQKATATVMVEGEDTAAVMAGARDDAEGTGIEPSSVSAPDGKIIAAVFADEFMPAGFTKTTVSYEEQMVEAAKFSMGNITLLYVTDEYGNEGDFKIYDETTGELKDFLMITSIENRFIIVLEPGADTEVPAGFKKVELQWGEKKLPAYAHEGSINGAAGGADDGSGTTEYAGASGGIEFELLYAMSSEGNLGWYMYDNVEGTYQRFNASIYGGAGSANAGESGEDDGVLSQLSSVVESPADGGVNVMLIIVIALAVLLIALIVTVIIMAIKLKEFNSYDYIDEDEDEYEGTGSAYYRDYEARKAEAERAAEEAEREKAARKAEADRKAERSSVSAAADEMPRTRNIYEQYRAEEEAKSAAQSTEKPADAAGAGVAAAAGIVAAGAINASSDSIREINNDDELQMVDLESEEMAGAEAGFGAVADAGANAESSAYSDRNAYSESAANEAPAAAEEPGGFVFRNRDKAREESERERLERERYERYGDENEAAIPDSRGGEDDDYLYEDDYFSPRDRKASRAEKKAAKAEAKAAKAEAKAKRKRFDDDEEEFDQRFSAGAGAAFAAVGAGTAVAAVNAGYDELEDDNYSEDRKLTRAEKKAAKAEEKARKKEEKRIKKEYGEFGPVNWQSWQDAVEGGEKTAASAARVQGAMQEDDIMQPEMPEEPMRRQTPQIPEEPVRRQAPMPEEPARRPAREMQPMQEEPVRRLTREEEMMYRQQYSEEPVRRQAGRVENEPVRRNRGVDDGAVRRPAPQPMDEPMYRPAREMQEEPMYRQPAQPAPQMPEDDYFAPEQKSNPMDMIRGIPANDNKQPVQAKPVQQFDFDDDFEFEFLDLEED